ncbi:MAG: hypothetical protein WCT85_01565, partial [Parachlamydiales bacterium]
GAIVLIAIIAIIIYKNKSDKKSTDIIDIKPDPPVYVEPNGQFTPAPPSPAPSKPPILSGTPNTNTTIRDRLPINDEWQAEVKGSNRTAWVKDSVGLYKPLHKLLSHGDRLKILSFKYGSGIDTSTMPAQVTPDGSIFYEVELIGSVYSKPNNSGYYSKYFAVLKNHIDIKYRSTNTSQNRFSSFDALNFKG